MSVDCVESPSCGLATLLSESRGRSCSTPERSAETVDVHYSGDQRSISRERPVEASVAASNHSVASSSGSPRHVSHHLHHHQQHQQHVQQHVQQPSQPMAVAAFHSLPRNNQPSATASLPASAGQIPESTNRSRNQARRWDASNATKWRSHSQSPPSQSRQGDDSLGSSEYTDPHTFPKETQSASVLVGSEKVVSRDSYDLLTDSGSAGSANAKPAVVDVSYILHRRVSPLAASKSYETVLKTPETPTGEPVELQRSRSFRSEKASSSMLYARAKLVDVDIIRPKSIEFVTFQNLPPPDAFSSRDDSVEQARHHFVASVEPCYPVVVDASSASSCEQRAETEDDVQDIDLVYQDTLSSTSLEEQLISDDQLLFEFVNDDDGLPDPLDDVSAQDDPIAAAEAQSGWQSTLDYVFQTHVLSRISERSCGSTCDSASRQDNTMSDVSSSFKADAIDADAINDAINAAAAASPTSPTSPTPPPTKTATTTTTIRCITCPLRLCLTWTRLTPLRSTKRCVCFRSHNYQRRKRANRKPMTSPHRPVLLIIFPTKLIQTTVRHRSKQILDTIPSALDSSEMN